MALNRGISFKVVTGQSNERPVVVGIMIPSKSTANIIILLSTFVDLLRNVNRETHDKIMLGNLSSKCWEFYAPS